MIIASRDWYNGAKMFYAFNQKQESLKRFFFTKIYRAYLIPTLRNKTAEMLSRPNNPELEIDFRTTCSAIQIDSFDRQLMQAYQDFLNAYQLKTSLYNIIGDYKRTNLIIYNTETHTQEVKNLRTFSNFKELDQGTCITQLPNGKLFCYGMDYPC